MEGEHQSDLPHPPDKLMGELDQAQIGPKTESNSPKPFDPQTPGLSEAERRALGNRVAGEKSDGKFFIDEMRGLLDAGKVNKDFVDVHSRLFNANPSNDPRDKELVRQFQEQIRPSETLQQDIPSLSPAEIEILATPPPGRRVSPVEFGLLEPSQSGREAWTTKLRDEVGAVNLEDRIINQRLADVEGTSIYTETGDNVVIYMADILEGKEVPGFDPDLGLDSVAGGIAVELERRGSMDKRHHYINVGQVREALDAGIAYELKERAMKEAFRGDEDPSELSERDFQRAMDAGRAEVARQAAGAEVVAEAATPAVSAEAAVISSEPDTANEFNLPVVDSRRTNFIQELGRGISGRVILTGAEGLGEVVIKFPNPDLASQADYAQERDIIAHLMRQKPPVERVAKLVALPPEGDRYLIKEYVDGPNLRWVAKELPPQVRANVAWELLKALSELHEVGVALNDAKPEDFIYTPEGSVKIIDLGNATTRDLRGGVPFGVETGQSRDCLRIFNQIFTFDPILSADGLLQIPYALAIKEANQYQSEEVMSSWREGFRQGQIDETLYKIAERLYESTKSQSQQPPYKDAQELMGALRPYFEKLGVDTSEEAVPEPESQPESTQPGGVQVEAGVGEVAAGEPAAIQREEVRRVPSERDREEARIYINTWLGKADEFLRKNGRARRDLAQGKSYLPALFRTYTEQEITDLGSLRIEDALHGKDVDSEQLEKGVEEFVSIALPYLLYDLGVGPNNPLLTDVLAHLTPDEAEAVIKGLANRHGLIV